MHGSTDPAYGLRGLEELSHMAAPQQQVGNESAPLLVQSPCRQHQPSTHNTPQWQGKEKKSSLRKKMKSRHFHVTSKQQKSPCFVLVMWPVLTLRQA